MKLSTARVQNYRSVKDTGEFDVEIGKTIMVGPNEAGKSAILGALQQIHAPKGVKPFDALRDYPRALYNDITKRKVDPADVPVATATFTLEDEDKKLLPLTMRECSYKLTRYLDNKAIDNLVNAPDAPSYGKIKNHLARLASHVDGRAPKPDEGKPAPPLPSEGLKKTTDKLADGDRINLAAAGLIQKWLDEVIPLVDEGNETEEKRRSDLWNELQIVYDRDSALKILKTRIPVFVLYNNFVRVRPNIHLAHFADRIERKTLDDEQYDYGNARLLKLLGFTAKELSELGKAVEPAVTKMVQQPPPGQTQSVAVLSTEYKAAYQQYRDQLDKRSYQLNAASVQLTNEVRRIWNPDSQHAEADKLRIQADGQYLKVVVEDDLGVEIELDQRSEGFQWLVSFFVVFFAEASEDHKNAILLLDEPGLSLHALKQREFRKTISRLSEANQTIYTTHSPFLVGPDELDLVRVVEMTDRVVGTKVHTSVTSQDPAALLPLQEALGYDLAQSMFTQQRNLVLEGLTDYWYIEAVSNLLAEAGTVTLNDKIAKIPARSAAKIAYFATILHANKLKVAALLDSDAAGDAAASQDTLVHMLGQKAILRTKDYLKSSVSKPEIEDLLRETLIEVAKGGLKWDLTTQAAKTPNRPIVDIFEEVYTDFSKFKLAKAFIRWSRDHEARDLTQTERSQWTALITAINKALS